MHYVACIDKDDGTHASAIARGVLDYMAGMKRPPLALLQELQDALDEEEGRNDSGNRSAS